MSTRRATAGHPTAVPSSQRGARTLPTGTPGKGETATALSGPRPCTRHLGKCAYPTDDPTRCPNCHRTWARITGRDQETPEHHHAEHTKWDARADADAARLAAKRKGTR